MTTPEAALGRLPLEGPSRKARRGWPGTPADRQSRIRGVCLNRLVEEHRQ
jgi:hypothetical protein